MICLCCTTKADKPGLAFIGPETCTIPSRIRVSTAFWSVLMNK